jgi:hypothetical protein
MYCYIALTPETADFLIDRLAEMGFDDRSNENDVNSEDLKWSVDDYYYVGFQENDKSIYLISRKTFDTC